MFLIYVVCKDKSQAQTLANVLLAKKLIACANLWPIESWYTWKNKITQDHEYVLLLKTRKRKYRLIEQEIIKYHSYEIPAIFGWEIDRVATPYYQWLQHATKP